MASRSKAHRIPCASGVLCRGGKGGGLAWLNPKDSRQADFAATGLCLACRRRNDNQKPESSNSTGSEAVKNGPAMPSPNIGHWLGQGSPQQHGGPHTDKLNSMADVPVSGPSSHPPAPTHAYSQVAVPVDPDADYRSAVIERAVKVIDAVQTSGRNYELAGGALSYEAAVDILADAAIARGLIENVDIVASMTKIEDVLRRHISDETATIAGLVAIGRPLVVLNDSGSGVETLLRSAGIEGWETAVLKAPRATASKADVDKAILSLAKQSSRIVPVGHSLLLIVSGLAGGHPDYKMELIRAMTNRRVMGLPVPEQVHFAMVETGAFSVSDYPPEILLNCVTMAVKSGEAGVSEVLSATEMRRRMLARQIETAKNEGDEAKVVTLEKLLAKTGYAGAAATHQPHDGQAKVRGDRADEMARRAIAGTSDETRHLRASVILDVTQPELSERRQTIARRMLEGTGGEGYADSVLSAYLVRNNANATGRLPNIEDIISGRSGTKDLHRAMSTGGETYMASLKSWLSESPLVAEAMRRGGEEAIRITEAYLAIMDHDPKVAQQILAASGSLRAGLGAN